MNERITIPDPYSVFTLAADAQSQPVPAPAFDIEFRRLTVPSVKDTACAIASSLSSVPALILYGSGDPMKRAGGPERFQRLFKHNKVVLVPGEQHFPLLGAPARVATEVRNFVAAHTPRRMESTPSSGSKLG